MNVLVHCDDQICHSEELLQRVAGVIAGTLERFSDHLGRVEAHLRDLNSSRSGERDKICSVDAQIARSGAHMTVTREAATLTEAIHDAADQLKRLLARELLTPG